MSLKIQIETIPHKKQRYPTCGDWQWIEQNSLTIKVSELKDWRMEALIGIHEAIEVLICKHRGVTEQSVDWFDFGYEAARKAINSKDNSEPGDSPTAPYFREHAFATKIEKMLAKELGVDWKKYTKEVNKLP